MVKFNADKAGAIASFICAIHCAAVGLAVGVLPLIGLSFLHEPWLEITFYVMAVFFGVWAAVRGWRLHRSWWPALLFGCGLSMVGFGHWAAEGIGEHSPLETVGHIISMVGGLTLVTFHILNARMTRSHACSCRACKDHRHDG